MQKQKLLKPKDLVNVNETNDTRNYPHKMKILFDCSFMLNLSLINYYLGSSRDEIRCIKKIPKQMLQRKCFTSLQ